MKKTVLLVLTIAIASTIGGCSFFSDANEAKQDLDEAAKKPIPRVNSKQKASAETAETPTEGEEFDDLEAEETEAETIQKIAGLIPATNADTRVRSSVRGRTDPFSVVSLIPEIEIEAPEVQPQPVNINNRNNREKTSTVQQPNTLQQPTNPIDEFRAELAQKVIISGLYESNGRTKLIVQAPEENNSRYVEVGQYLSNGQILVKSIDSNHFPTPLVTLEQRGVEIQKAVGESPEDSKQAMLPAGNSAPLPLASSISFNLENIE